jgi:hypothetical protein
MIYIGLYPATAIGDTIVLRLCMPTFPGALLAEEYPPQPFDENTYLRQKEEQNDPGKEAASRYFQGNSQRNYLSLVAYHHYSTASPSILSFQ